MSPTPDANGEESASDGDLLTRGYILQCSVILYTGSEDPDQTVNVQADLGIRCRHYYGVRHT